ncbi:MAG: class I SAM-dependent methyltransferase [Brevefilum fermentans]|nr:class I SAM-dependent methyltransferase [Brevefilum fermentans]MDI9566725.1 class I SAM-dependent methyltransferase [Chloroflexota bacterium]
MLQSQERALLSCLKEFGFQSLNQSKILEIGCGRGGVMLGFLRYGATASNLSGIDILLDRVVLAKQTLPESKISCADGQFLPYESAQFDILLQFTAFSSILDPQIKRNMASEMLRVLKPDGVILWYDFWWNPTNPQTAGIKPKEIKILFSNCVFKLHKITLAPPIARLIVPISWALAVILESLKVFNSHYLAIITKQ